MDMEAPNVASTLYDEENDVTYRVWAYRELSREEVIASIKMWRSRRKAPKRGSQWDIVTVIGFGEQ